MQKFSKSLEINSVTSLSNIAICIKYVRLQVSLHLKFTDRYLSNSFFPFLPPTKKLFRSQMKGRTNIRLIYSSAMALILPQLKDIAPLIYWLYIRRHRFPLYDLSQITVCLYVCLKFETNSYMEMKTSIKNKKKQLFQK